MQTFLPEPNFWHTAQVLDWKRLGNQRRESITLLNGGWENHPASKMWRGYEHALCRYSIIICKEWISRGYNDSMLPKFKAILNKYPCTGLPYWFGDMRLHVSHRSNLVRKLPEHYRKIYPDVPDDLPYYWP